MSLEFNGTNFKSEVLESDLPVLVDFGAEWCGPCRMIGPVIEQLAGRYEDRVKVGKVNVDAEPGLAASYGVQSIPTLIVFKSGAAVAQRVGMATPADLSAWLDELT